MRISDALAARRAFSAAPTRTRAAFRLPAEGAVAVRGAGVAAPLFAVDAAGAVEGATERRRRMARKGRSLLDALDELRLAVLSGQSPEAALGRISAESSGREASGDVALDDILSGIELRAAVELAKAGRRGRG